MNSNGLQLAFEMVNLPDVHGQIYLGAALLTLFTVGLDFLTHRGESAVFAARAKEDPAASARVERRAPLRGAAGTYTASALVALAVDFILYVGEIAQHAQKQPQVVPSFLSTFVVFGVLLYYAAYLTICRILEADAGLRSADLVNDPELLGLRKKERYLLAVMDGSVQTPSPLGEGFGDSDHQSPHRRALCATALTECKKAIVTRHLSLLEGCNKMEVVYTGVAYFMAAIAWIVGALLILVIHP